MDEASLVLGAVALLPLLARSIALSFEAYGRYKKYEETVEMYLDDLKYEKRVLWTTLRDMGLASDTPLEDVCKCFDEKFSPRDANDLKGAVRRMHDAMAEQQRRLGVTDNPKLVRPSRLHRFLKSLRPEGDELIITLRDLNDRVSNITKRSDVPVADYSRLVSGLTGRFQARRCQQLRQHLASLDRAGLCDCACQRPHQAAVDIDVSAFKPATTAEQPQWTFSVRVLIDAYETWQRLHITGKEEEAEGATADPAAARWTNPLLAPSPPRLGDSPPLSDGPRRSKGKSVNQFPQQFPTSPPTPVASPPARAGSGTTSLCAGLREGSSWKFSGLFYDPRFKQLKKCHFSAVTATDPWFTLKEPMPLKGFLNKQITLLSEIQRCDIAAAVAWSILHFSEGPWLDHQWTENQLCVFSETFGNGQTRYAEHPAVASVLGGTAALDATDKQKPKKPELQRTNDIFTSFIRNLNIFALGIALIELGIGKPFEQLCEDMRCSESSADAQQACPSPLLESYAMALNMLSNLPPELGHAYHQAAERCIKFSFAGPEETKNFQHESFLLEFYQTVVAPIQATYLGKIEDRTLGY